MASLDFRALLEGSPNPYMVVDRELRYVWANAEYARVTGAPVEALIGRNLLEVFPHDPDDPNNEPARMLRESFERVIESGDVDALAFIPYRVPRMTPAGVVHEERLWSATHTPILDADGRVAFVLQHTVDVTELQRLRPAANRRGPDDTGQMQAGVLQRARRVQETSLVLDEERRRLRRLFEQAPGFMAFLRGRDHVFEPANNAYFQLIGHRDILGTPVREALPEVAGQGFIDLLDRVFTSGEPYVGRSVRALLRGDEDGALDERYLDLLYHPVFDAAGDVTGIFVQGHDITEQKRLEAARARLLEAERAARAEAETARAEAEHANRLKDEFLATLSHELRTPLNALLGWARMLRTESMDPSRRERALESIERNAAIQARLVQDILDVSAIITGKLRLKVAPLDIAEVIAAALDTVKPAADAKGVEIRRRGVADAPLIGDAARLQQVIWNVLANAVKFTPAGGSVEVHLAEGPDGVAVTIADTGAGIPVHVLPFIFERFRQGESGSERVVHGGLGLGLSIVKHVVEAHGGEVRAESGGPGQGATFTVRLPRRAGAAVSSEASIVTQA